LGNLALFHFAVISLHYFFVGFLGAVAVSAMDELEELNFLFLEAPSKKFFYY
jgi:hypothetical protein